VARIEDRPLGVHQGPDRAALLQELDGHWEGHDGTQRRTDSGSGRNRIVERRTGLLAHGIVGAGGGCGGLGQVGARGFVTGASFNTDARVRPGAFPVLASRPRPVGDPVGGGAKGSVAAGAQGGRAQSNVAQGIINRYTQSSTEAVDVAMLLAVKAASAAVRAVIPVACHPGGINAGREAAGLLRVGF